MKSVVILFVALTMLLKPLWPVADYIVNYDYIVNVLCENKDTPQLNCDGKCYLAKQLAKENKDDGNNPFEQRHITVEQVYPICYQTLLDFEFSEWFCFSSKNLIGYSKILFSSPNLLRLIQPPEMC
jgi:hypothetical protein